MPTRNLFFIDESAATTKLTRAYARAPKGERAVDYVPLSSWKTVTFLAALTVEGIKAPFLIEGPMDGKAFLLYVKQCLCPCLKQGDIVVCDNVAFHKTKGVKEAIEEKGATLLYLPPYSPDFNPIELFFSKLKAFLKANKPETLADICSLIALVIQSLIPAECENFFRHCNYYS